MNMSKFPAATKPDGAEGESALAEVAYRYLRDAILSNELPSGFQCAEVEIAARIGMSRTPVHEAMTRLQEDGLVQIIPRKGILVRSLTTKDMLEIYDILIALEGAAAEILASGTLPAFDEIVAHLESVTDAMDAALARDDLEAWRVADEAFHDGLIAACANGRLIRMAQTVTLQSHRARRLTLHLRPTPVNSAREHRAILTAIRLQDPSAAGQVARDHRRRARAELVPVLDRLGGRLP